MQFMPSAPQWLRQLAAHNAPPGTRAVGWLKLDSGGVNVRYSDGSYRYLSVEELADMHS